MEGGALGPDPIRTAGIGYIRQGWFKILETDQHIYLQEQVPFRANSADFRKPFSPVLFRSNRLKI